MSKGHDQPCYYCGEPCNIYAGNPGLWPLGFTDEPGVVKWHHTGCVQDRLRELEKIKAELAETWDVIGGPPEHPEEDPEVSTLPAAVRVTVEYERDQRDLVRQCLKGAEKERDTIVDAARRWRAAKIVCRSTSGTSSATEARNAEQEAEQNFWTVLLSLDEDSGGSGELASAKPNDAGRRVPASTGPHAASREGPEPAGFHLYECAECSSKPGAPFLCARCLVARTAAGDEWRGPLPKNPEPAENSCLYINEDCDPPRPCRRRGGHSGPHTSSLNEARRLDAVVTHEDLKKLRDELIEALEEVTVDRPHQGFGGVAEVPAGFRELAKILRGKRS